MRKCLMIAALAATFAVAGCAAGREGAGGGSIINPSTVTQIQNAATQICGFVPTASTVASIIATFTGGGAVVDRVSQIANGICAVVTKKGARRGVAQYRGVAIQGNFVRR